MDPRIRKRASFVVLGTVTRFLRGSEGPELSEGTWKGFESRRPEIEPFSTDGSYYGVTFPASDPRTSDYLAGMAVADDALIPEGTEKRIVAAGEYAVFESAVTAIGQTYRHIFTEWLPLSRYEVVSAAAFEEYPPARSPGRPVLIHIPIRRKPES